VTLIPVFSLAGGVHCQHHQQTCGETACTAFILDEDGPPQSAAIAIHEKLSVEVADLLEPGKPMKITAEVDKEGDLSFPIVPGSKTLIKVKAAGKTCKDVEQSIAKAYKDANVLNNATVTVTKAK